MDPQKAWEIENAVRLVDKTRDALYDYDHASQKSINTAKPWRGNPQYFKNVRISAVALLKMTIHARSGGDIEVMGLMLGKVEHETFIVTDAVRLPVEGTETRVNAGSEADEYAAQYLSLSRDAGQADNAVGWYHSHPGYGCWLSGIDVQTEHNNQLYQDPFLAVVIDPHRTISAGKVEIGAFRTYPEGYKPEGAESSDTGLAAVPTAKAADFGAHANRYYALEVSHYKSTLDSKILEQLWNKYWVQTLSSSPLFTNREYVTSQIADLAVKTRMLHERAKAQGDAPYSNMGGGLSRKSKGGDEEMKKVVRLAEKIAREEKMGVVAAMVKERVFACGCRPAKIDQAAKEVEAFGTNGANGHGAEQADTQMVDVKAA